jgi:predicted permease
MTRLPRLGRLLVALRPLGDRRAEVEADLLELFGIRAARDGCRAARRRYVLDAISLWRIRRHPSVIPDQGSERGLQTMPQDVLFTFRLFRRHASLFAATIAGLAVAIALSAAMFSIVKAVALAGTGFDAETVSVNLASGPFTRVTGNSAMSGEWAYSDYVRLREDVTALTLVAAAKSMTRYRGVDGTDAGMPVHYRAVSGDYFTVLGVKTVVGRGLLAADDRPQVRNAVVSRGFWLNAMGGEHSIVGKTVLLDNEAFTIVGVADRQHGAPAGMRNPPAFWITLTALSETVPAANWNPAVEIRGRLKPAATKPQAQAEVLNVARVLSAPVTKQPPTVILEPPHIPNRQTRMVAGVLMTIVGLVVLLACANVANVLLASAASRRREIGTRLAIGASRLRILRQLLTEAVLLGLAGGAAGLLIARAIVPVLRSLMRVPVAMDVSPDPAMYGFVALMTIVVGLLAGLAPARYGYRGDVMSALKVDQLSAPLPLPRARLRSFLVGGQAAVSIVLLVVAALLTRALIDTAFLDAGHDVNRLLGVAVSTGPAPRATDQNAAYWSRVREHVLGVPGVRGAAFASLPPFDGTTGMQPFNGIRVSRNETTSEYFETLGMRIERGRAYTADEVRSGAPVAVVSASLARAFWGTDSPLGKSMERVWGTVAAADERKGMMRKVRGTRVIGVVSDVTTHIDHRNAPTIYLPLSEHVVPRLVVSTSGDPAALAGSLKDAIQTFDPRLRPMVSLPRQELARQLEAPRSLALLAIAVGAIALGLAAIGLFGVTAFVVEQRMHEMSVRRALGATTGQLVELLLRENLRPVGIGLACGLVVSLAAGRVVESVLYGTSSRDALAFIAASLILLAAAAAAVIVPARKAGRVDSALLLKQG